MTLVDYSVDWTEQLQFETLEARLMDKTQLSNLQIGEFVIVESRLLRGVKPKDVDMDRLGWLRDNRHYQAEVFSPLAESGYMAVRPLSELSEINGNGIVNIIEPGVRHDPIIMGSVVTRLWTYFA